jgi:hypothetical protein
MKPLRGMATALAVLLVLSGAACGPVINVKTDAGTDAGPTDAGVTCLTVGDAGDSCTVSGCCGVGLACVSGTCSTECAAYGHPCSSAMPCCEAPSPNIEVCNNLGYCQTE